LFEFVVEDRLSISVLQKPLSQYANWNWRYVFPPSKIQNLSNI